MQLMGPVVNYRTAFFEGCFKLCKKGRKLFWKKVEFADDPDDEIPPKTFKTIDEALYWARLWEYAYYRNTRKFCELTY